MEETPLYDLIVCNPPYFENSLKAPDSKRSVARHTDSLSYQELFEAVSRLLSDSGIFAMVTPAEHLPKLKVIASDKSLFLIRQTNVYPTPKAKVKRVLLEFSKTEKPIIIDDITIEVARHRYTDEYKALTKDFYLDMK